MGALGNPTPRPLAMIHSRLARDRLDVMAEVRMNYGDNLNKCLPLFGGTRNY
jgi:hypothetical protein